MKLNCRGIYLHLGHFASLKKTANEAEETLYMAIKSFAKKSL
jgi:hypothetical protein